MDVPKVPKQPEAKRNGVMNPKITISINFNMLSKRYESTEVDRDYINKLVYS